VTRSSGTGSSRCRLGAVNGKGFITGTALVFILWSPVPAHQPSEELLNASAKLTDGFQLEFTVTWTGKEELRLPEADLPWGTVNSTVIIAVTAAGDVLPRELPIDDPGPGTVVLRPGVPSQGRVQLLRLYPQLKRLASRTEVIVFWSYRPRAIAKIGRTGGWVRVAGPQAGR
jgi:hypothetical protein